MLNNQSVDNIPESIKTIANAVKGLNREELSHLKTLSQLNKRLAQHQYGFSIVSSLIKLGLPATNHFLQKATVLSVLLDDELSLIIQYEDWFINLVELVQNGITDKSLYPATNRPKFVVINRDNLLSITVGRYGLDSERFIGIDFASDEWINILLAKNTLSEVIIMFLISSFDRNEFINFVEKNINNEEIKRGLISESFIGVRYVLQKIIKFGLHSELIKKSFDIKNLVTIAHGLDSEYIDVYWVELGNYFVVANDSTPHGIEIGRLSDFNIDALSKNTLNDYLTQEQFKKFNLIELFKH